MKEEGMNNFIKNNILKKHHPDFGALEIFKYIGPGLLVTIGFIDPGNWAANVAAGSGYGYLLLWMITLSTIMLIILQHNVAHLGIATGLCLSEAATVYTPKWISRSILSTAMIASVSTSLAEILGGSIALNMLFHIPLIIGSIIILLVVVWLLFSNSYRRLEKYIIGFVSIIGISFIYELTLMNVNWAQAVHGWIIPVIPNGSMVIVMSVLGAVVMPHNLFLHSEIIQSRQWNLKDTSVIRKQLNFEFIDTLFSMIIGWAINSAMILVAAATFFQNKFIVTELQQADNLLKPLLGNFAAVVFAMALLFSGIASSITSGMAGGSIFSGFFNEPYSIKDTHSRLGIMISLVLAVLVIFIIGDPFRGLIISQMILSIQLPFTVFLQIYLTSSRKVMGEYANTRFLNIILLIIGFIITYLNIRLLMSLL
jgi:manganese transport protein